MTDNKTFWNKEAEKFSRSGNKESKRLVEKSLPYLNEKDKLLDFACGTGQSSLLFSDHLHSVVGLDYSEEMIRYANENSKENVTFFSGSLDHSILEVGSFDVIVAFNVLHLMDDLKTVKETFYKALKPGGYFISYSPCMTNKKSVWVWLIQFLSKLKLFPSVFPFTADELIKELSDQNFSLVEESYDGDKIQNAFLVLKKEV